MPTCPICARGLETARQREGVYYPCPSCQGRAVTVSQLRHVLGDRVAVKLLRLMGSARRPSGRYCPFCDRPMLVVSTQASLLELDACPGCNVVWSDRPTYESLSDLGLAAVVETTSSIALQATEIIAMERLKELKARQEAERRKEKHRRGW
jgi:Zn-finger nucleic acid-binding protein